MRVFKTRAFMRFQRKERISNDSLCKAVTDAEAGLIGADLGRGLIKQRVARAGGGKRSGFRTIVAYRVATRSVFLFGFAKNRMENLEPDELADLAVLGADWLAADDDAIDVAIIAEKLTEVFCDSWAIKEA